LETFYFNANFYSCKSKITGEDVIAVDDGASAEVGEAKSGHGTKRHLVA
jgi:hypothetical protein